MPYVLRLSAYNEAGELVKTIFQGPSSALPGAVEAPARGLLIGVDSLQLLLNGEFRTFSWDLHNDSGQPVSGGLYYLKADFMNSFGGSEAFISPLRLIQAAQGSSVVIYNSAGEAVKHLAAPPGCLEALIDIAPLAGDGAFVPEMGDLSIKGRDLRGGDCVLSWDGSNDFGAPVSGGSYKIQLVNVGVDRDVVVKREIQVLRSGAPASLQGSLLAPNPLTKDARRLVLSYPPAPRLSLTARVYDLAGELVKQASQQAALGRLEIEANTLSGGIYVVDVELKNSSQSVARILIKLAVAK